HYLLLRNAWDSNPALAARLYTEEFRRQVGASVRAAYEPFFEGAKPVAAAALEAEFNTKMVNDLLHNEDTMSMAHSVESRVPLLDLDLVRFAARIPHRLRLAGGLKALLKAALRDLVP